MLTKYPTISSALIFLTALVTSYAGNETKSTLTQSDDSTVISEDGIAALSISDTEKLHQATLLMNLKVRVTIYYLISSSQASATAAITLQTLSQAPGQIR